MFDPIAGSLLYLITGFPWETGAETLSSKTVLSFSEQSKRHTMKIVWKNDKI